MSISMVLSSTGRGCRLLSLLQSLLPACAILGGINLAVWNTAQAADLPKPHVNIVSVPLRDHGAARDDGEPGRFNGLSSDRTGIDFVHRHLPAATANRDIERAKVWGGYAWETTTATG